MSSDGNHCFGKIGRQWYACLYTQLRGSIFIIFHSIIIYFQMSMSVDWTKVAVITNVSTKVDRTTVPVLKATLFKAITELVLQVITPSLCKHEFMQH